MVGDEENGHPVIDGRSEQLQDFHLVADVEARRGFVQEQHIRLLRECPGHPGSLDLTAGQRREESLCQALDVAHTHGLGYGLFVRGCF